MGRGWLAWVLFGVGACGAAVDPPVPPTPVEGIVPGMRTRSASRTTRGPSCGYPSSSTRRDLPAHSRNWRRYPPAGRTPVATSRLHRAVRRKGSAGGEWDVGLHGRHAVGYTRAARAREPHPRSPRTSGDRRPPNTGRLRPPDRHRRTRPGRLPAAHPSPSGTAGHRAPLERVHLGWKHLRSRRRHPDGRGPHPRGAAAR